MNTNRIRVIAYGITLGFLILPSLDGENKSKTIAASTDQGTLTLVANGEDFVRQGFVSKDGWQINFDHLYVNLGEAIAYSTESSFEPQKNDTKNSIEYQQKVELLNNGKIVDLAEGEADAEPIVINDATVPAGFYNALAWNLTPINQPTEYVCGEFVGDVRQGIVAVDTPGTVEVTFHFDHIFGDQDTPPEDALNQDALGFQPLAALASNNTVKLSDTDLANQLTTEDYQQLTEAIAGLGHVGEGHCVVTNSQ